MYKLIYVLLLVVASFVIVLAALQLMSRPVYAAEGFKCKIQNCDMWLRCNCDGIWEEGIQFPCGGYIFCPVWPEIPCSDYNGTLADWCQC